MTGSRSSAINWVGSAINRSFKTDELRVVKLTVPDVFESAHGRLRVRLLPRTLGCFIAVDGPVFSEIYSAYGILHSTLKKLNTTNKLKYTQRYKILTVINVNRKNIE